MQTCPTCQARNTDTASFCSSCGSPLGAGTQLTGTLPAQSVLHGRYRIVRLLGQGGMGAVYQAGDLRLTGATWAVKEMSDAQLLNPAERQQALVTFQREAQVLASLTHPNLPRVVDYFSQAGKQYMVMEYVAGQNLEEVLAAAPEFLDEAQVLDWIGQVCDVLTYLHSQQPPVIFRDLKPANIMVDAQGRVKLIDFGIVRHFKPGQAADTQAIGTPGYAAPEQHGKGQTDARSDIYALGVTLHSLLTGHDPAHTPFNLPPACSLNPQISPRIEALIQRATQIDPTQRYPSAAAMKQALALPAPIPQPAPSPAPVPPQRQRVVPIVGLGIILVCILALSPIGWSFLKGETPTPISTLTPSHTFTLSPTPTPTPTRDSSLFTTTATPTPVASHIPTSTALPTSTTPAVTAIPTPAAGEVRPWPVDDALMAYIPPGEFLMGSAAGDSDERPEHQVYLDGFWIDRYEVTNRQFRRFVDSTGYQTTAEQEGWSHVWTGSNAWVEKAGANWRQPAGPGSTISGLEEHPVVAVSWYDAEAYCQWADKRLPTEAEWEKAARGTEQRRWAWGDSWSCAGGNFDDETALDAQTVGCSDGFARTAPVGALGDGASPYGVYDLSGNVSEWIADWYGADSYSYSPASNPSGPAEGTQRILRGGGWFSLKNFTVTRRRPASPSERVETIGFRCASSEFP